MNTPIADFLDRYTQSGTLRLHMPGHKGSISASDITEIDGADVLYHSHGIIRESEENAARLFGSARTVYSAEGASLSIRAMVYLACMWAKKQGRRPSVLAGRNAHKAFMYACAVCDPDVEWICAGGDLLSCVVTPGALEERLDALSESPAAVYVTSPDYIGSMCDIAALAEACHRRGSLLLVDNAHGAYLNFVPEGRHPMACGADMCCDSGHKTLPVLTGGAYLHIGRTAPAEISGWAEDAMALFASTSPSYLIMRSLDEANRALAEEYPWKAAALTKRLSDMRVRLENSGLKVSRGEPMKLTLLFSGSGERMAEALRLHGIECEFADPWHLVLMPSPDTAEGELDRLEAALLSLPRENGTGSAVPAAPGAERVLTIRQAMFSPRESVQLYAAQGRVLADACVSCPPAVPILIAGERITEEAVRCFEFFGIDRLTVVAECDKTNRNETLT